MQRGEIWWASLRGPRGAEPGKHRPVLVVQSNAFNKSNIQTVIVAALTSRLERSLAPGNVHLSAKQCGLKQASVVNVSQLLTVDRQFLTEPVTTLPKATMAKVAAGMRLVLDL